MLKKSRFYISAMLTALVLVSLLITSNVKACEDAPQTLLSLFMNSDLVVLAKYEGNGESKKVSEDEYGYSLEANRNLAISKIFKGQNDLKRVSFLFSDYVSIPQPTDPANTAAETEHYETEDYFDVSKIKVGEQYLFFLSKDAETGEYRITDYSSGAKEVGGKLEVYEKSLTELASIAASEENRYAKLTEWIVKSIEEPITREDAISDLSESMYSLNNQEEQPELKDQGPFVVNEGYGIYTVGVAAKLSQTQISRVSAVLYPMLQEAWFAETPVYANYSVGTVLGGFNKSRLAVYAYTSLQSVAKDDLERRSIIMEFLTTTIEDQSFSDIYYKYVELEGKIKEAANETPQEKQQMKIMLASKNTMLKNFEKRFKFMLERNFVKVEDPQV
jgi:hypothetical protein